VSSDTSQLSRLYALLVVVRGRAEKPGDEGHKVMVVGWQVSGWSGRVVSKVRRCAAVELVAEEPFERVVGGQGGGARRIGDAAQ